MGLQLPLQLQLQLQLQLPLQLQLQLPQPQPQLQLQKQPLGDVYSEGTDDPPEYSAHQHDQRGRQQQHVGQRLCRRAEESSGQRQEESQRRRNHLSQPHRGRNRFGRHPLRKRIRVSRSLQRIGKLCSENFSRDGKGNHSGNFERKTFG